MLTPEQLQNLPQELTDLYDQLSEFILRYIARRIAKGVQITDTAEYQLYRARSLGLSTDEIAEKIAEINGSSAAEINRLIREAAAQSDEFDRKMLGADKGAAIPLEENTQLQKLISAQIYHSRGSAHSMRLLRKRIKTGDMRLGFYTGRSKSFDHREELLSRRDISEPQGSVYPIRLKAWFQSN